MRTKSKEVRGIEAYPLLSDLFFWRWRHRKTRRNGCLARGRRCEACRRCWWLGAHALHDKGPGEDEGDVLWRVGVRRNVQSGRVCASDSVSSALLNKAGYTWIMTQRTRFYISRGHERRGILCICSARHRERTRLGPTMARAGTNRRKP